MKKVKVFGWSKDADRNIIGKYNSKPMLNTMLYYVDFPNGAIRKYGSNIISDNIYSQVDSEGFLHSILFGTFDFFQDNTVVQKGDQYIITKSGQFSMQKSTVGWNLLIY